MLQRVREAAEDGLIGDVARFHCSFMGATPSDKLCATAEQVAKTTLAGGTHVALLVPV